MSTPLKVNERIWRIECNNEPVDHMFDAQGSETFDVTQAVEVVGGFYVTPRTLIENDVITYTLLMDGP